MLKPFNPTKKISIWALFVLLLLLPLALRVYKGAPIIPVDSSYVYLQYLPASMFWIAVPLLLGVCSFALLACILGKIFPKEKQYCILLLFLITPLALSIHSTLTIVSIFFFLFLVSLYFYLQKNFFWSAAPIIFMLLIDPVPAAMYSVALAGHAFLQKQRAYLVLPIIAVFFTLVFFQPLPQKQLLFAEFGAVYGFSFFIILLGVCSLLLFWKSTNFLLVVSWCVLLYVSQYYVSLRILLLLPLLMKTADTLLFLEKKQWALSMLKKASFILLICLGLFILITHVQTLLYAAPQVPLPILAQHMDADSRQGAILTSVDHDDALRFFSSRSVIGIDDSHEFFSSATLTKVSPFLVANDVRYILITPQMKSGRVWERDDEGLLFLLHNNGKFINTLTVDEYESWLVLQEYVG